MSASAKAKKAVLGVAIPRDVLALRIAQPCLGMIAPKDIDATRELDRMNEMGGPVLMGESFRRAADAAVLYFHECVNAGSQPS